MAKIDYISWNQEEIQNQIEKLTSLSKLSYRRDNHIIELGDGIIRISSMQDDKSWSDWKTVETPNLHLKKGKIVAIDETRLLIYVSSNESYELCSSEDESWTDDECYNMFRVSNHASLIISRILDGQLENASRLTTRKPIPSPAYQWGILQPMMMENQQLLRLSKEAKIAEANVEFESSGWVRFFPYEKSKYVWTPLQEVAYLETLLKTKTQQNVKLSQSQPIKSSARTLRPIGNEYNHVRDACKGLANSLIDLLRNAKSRKSKPNRNEYNHVRDAYKEVASSLLDLSRNIKERLLDFFD